MIALAIRYRYLIAFLALSGIITGGWLYIRHLQSENAILTSQREEYKANFNACQNNFKINKEVSDAYFEQNLNLRREFDANKLRLTKNCIPVSAAGRPDAPAPRGDVRGNGLDAHALHDYGRRCGENENQLKHLKGWVKETRGYNQ